MHGKEVYKSGKATCVRQNSLFLRNKFAYFNVPGPVAQSKVRAYRWLRGIESYTFIWWLTLDSATYASSN